jgi:hypothetical protein
LSCRKAWQFEKDLGELIVTCCDSAIDLEMADDVFDAVSLTVKLLVATLSEVTTDGRPCRRPTKKSECGSRGQLAKIAMLAMNCFHHNEARLDAHECRIKTWHAPSRGLSLLPVARFAASAEPAASSPMAGRRCLRISNATHLRAAYSHVD